MWSIIRIRVPYLCHDIRRWARSTRRFIRVCLERSQSTLLDISLDFSCLQESTGRRITIEWDENGWDLLNADTAEYYEVTLRLQELGAIHPGTRDRKLVARNSDYALNLLSDLIGPGGVAARRWRSLEVHFPLQDPALELWKSIMRPFPNLTSVSFYKTNKISMHLLSHRYPSNCFPQVGQLLVWDMYMDSGILCHFPLSLRSLSVSIRLGGGYPLQLSRFTQLRTLSIDLQGRPAPDETKICLSLPFLQELSFFGWSQPPVAMMFDAPRLVHMLAEWSWRQRFTGHMPVVQPPHLLWEPFDKPRDDRELELAKNAMRHLLLHFTATETFNVPHCMKLALYELVKELMPDGFLATAWKRFSFRDGKDVLETVELSDAMHRSDVQHN